MKQSWFADNQNAHNILPLHGLLIVSVLCHLQPTNHLDIPSKEMLEDALVAFEGAVIAVSHDRYFLRKIATRIIAVRLLSGPVPPIWVCNLPDMLRQAPDIWNVAVSI